jgi:hypothetical protein
MLINLTAEYNIMDYKFDFIIQERLMDNAARAEKINKEMDEGNPAGFYREPLAEAKRGREMAKAVASDREFLDDLESMKDLQKKSERLRTYLYMENLADKSNHLTAMSLGVCMYLLKTKYDIDTGIETEKSSTWPGIVKELLSEAQ